jgi:hypothetical protein
LSVTAMVGDGLMRVIVSDRKAIGISAFLRELRTGRGDGGQDSMRDGGHQQQE